MRSKANKKAQPELGPSIAAVIVCAGKGERTGLAYNKILYHLGQKTVLETVLDKFAESAVQQIIVVAAADDLSTVTDLIRDYPNVDICTGGPTRSASVLNGLRKVGNCDIVVIHDGARPFISPALINASIESTKQYGSGVVAVPTVDTIKEVSDNNVVRSLTRSGLYNIQTPQTFKYSDILNAYENVQGVFTDDAEVYERAGFIPHIVIGSYDNIKITTSSDLNKAVPESVRIGVGFDVHKLVSKRPLILGGLRIPYKKGLKGHSDADVLTHAIMDAMLSAADFPDIGVLFPDTDPAFLNISSMVLLDDVVGLLRGKNFKVNNISAVIIAQKPKMAPVISEIAKNLALHIGIEPNRINISATTTEELGIVGKGKAIAASASCLLTVLG